MTPQPALARLEALISKAQESDDPYFAGSIHVTDLLPILADLTREHEALKQERDAWQHARYVAHEQREQQHQQWVKAEAAVTSLTAQLEAMKAERDALNNDRIAQWNERERSALATEWPDDPTRCAVCGWMLAVSLDKGCVRGNCSLRPLPKRWYAPERAAQEGYGDHSPARAARLSDQEPR